MTKTEVGRVRPEPADLVRRVLAAVASPPSRATDTPGASPDADLLAACAAAVAVARRKIALFDGPGRIEDDAVRDAALEPLDAQQRPFLEAAARAVPATWSGHIARAATLLLWDAGGLHNEARLGSAGERLLAAVVHDLAAAS